MVLVALVMAKVGLVMRRMLSITSSPPPPVLVDITKVDTGALMCGQWIYNNNKIMIMVVLW